MEEGIEQGVNNRNKEIVLQMYNKNLSFELISEYTNISRQEVEKIIKNS